MTPVTPGEIPSWMILAWQLYRPEKYQLREGVIEVVECEMEMQHVVGETKILAWDHWGSTVIDGQNCFVSEPYCTKERATKAFSPLAKILRCKMTVSKDSDYGYGTIRVVLYPPIENCADCPQK